MSQNPPNWFQIQQDVLSATENQVAAKAVTVGQQTATQIQQAGTSIEQTAAGISVIGGVLGGAWSAVKDWIANPLRVIKLALGITFITLSIVIAFLPEIGAVIAIASGAPELAPAIRAAGRKPKQTAAQVEQASVQEGFRQVTAGRPQPRRIATPPNRPGAAPGPFPGQPPTPPQPPAGPPAPRGPLGILGNIPSPFTTNPAWAMPPKVTVRPATPSAPLPIPQIPQPGVPSGQFRTDPGEGGGVGVLGAGAQAADAANRPLPANEPLSRIIGGRLATPSASQQRQTRRNAGTLISQLQRIADNPNLPSQERAEANQRIDDLRAVMLAPTQPPSRPPLPPPSRPETSDVDKALAAFLHGTESGEFEPPITEEEVRGNIIRPLAPNQQRQYRPRSVETIRDEALAALQHQERARYQREWGLRQITPPAQAYVPGGGAVPTPIVAPLETPITTPLLSDELLERLMGQRHQIGRQQLRDQIAQIAEAQAAEDESEINRRIRRARRQRGLSTTGGPFLAPTPAPEPLTDEAMDAINARIRELRKQMAITQPSPRRLRQARTTQPGKRYPKYHD